MVNDYPADWEKVVLTTLARTKSWQLRQNHREYIDIDKWLNSAHKQDEKEVHVSITFIRNEFNGISDINMSFIEQQYKHGENVQVGPERCLELTWPVVIEILEKW